MTFSEAYRGTVRDALRRLDIRNLVLCIHDSSFPSDDDDDTGRGSPYSPSGLRLLRFLRELGFNGIQFGPQGKTPEHDPSPYNGTVFSRNVLSISLARLAGDRRWEGLLSAQQLARWVAARPPHGDRRVPHAHVHRVHHEALRMAFLRFRQALERGQPQTVHLAQQLRRFEQWNARWLERDALFEAVRLEHPSESWRRWSGVADAALDGRLWNPAPGEERACRRRRLQLEAAHGEELACYRFGQFLAQEQHRRLLRVTRRWGFQLYGDLQAGLSDQDAWSYQSLLLPGHWMGAPPSRTNPDGQPWRYAVLDPSQYGTREQPGPVLAFLSARADKMFAEFDAVRVDHPHGLVCPWVYRDDEDPIRAVRHGARLFASPDLPDHPELARFAIVGREQLNPDPDTPRHADDWVVRLTPEQVDRYAVLFDAVLASARRRRRDASRIVCEVLSTMPLPLQRVMERQGLGRFRVTQKANLADPDDVYHSENALPQDWVMVGNHDTPPLWLLLEKWRKEGHLAERARHLAARLVGPGAGREDLERELAEHPGRLAQAQFADLFASRAQNVLIFFSDLFGSREVYNRPGTVSSANWSLRLARGYVRDYLARLEYDRALNLPAALAMALRGRVRSATDRELVARLEAQAEALRARR